MISGFVMIRSGQAPEHDEFLVITTIDEGRRLRSPAVWKTFDMIQVKGGLAANELSPTFSLSLAICPRR
jgi:hypothetical protein